MVRSNWSLCCHKTKISSVQHLLQSEKGNRRTTIVQLFPFLSLVLPDPCDICRSCALCKTNICNCTQMWARVTAPSFQMSDERIITKWFWGKSKCPEKVYVSLIKSIAVLKQKERSKLDILVRSAMDILVGQQQTQLKVIFMFKDRLQRLKSLQAS